MVFPLSAQLPFVLSLFSGAGGLDLGFVQQGFQVKLAIDRMPDAIRTHRRNFPHSRSVCADLSELGPSGVSDLLHEEIPSGSKLAIIGGPPCQGFSRANVRSTREDPRNKLALLYLEIVEALQSHFSVSVVLLENVLGIRDSKHLKTFDGLVTKFLELGLQANVATYSALDFGVPQRRERVIITGFASAECAKSFQPKFTSATDLTVRGAISGLPDPAFFQRGIDPSTIPHHPNHWTMRPLSKRFEDPDNWTAGGRSFRRLDWDKPSPTVAYGHREIHVHPEGRRRLSIYEAMKLQGFPEPFVLEGTLSGQVEQISNAVPPPLANALAAATKSSLQSIE